MVVGGGLIEDVCKLEKMPGWPGYPATSQGQLKNKEGIAPRQPPLSGGLDYDVTHGGSQILLEVLPGHHGKIPPTIGSHPTG
jgi:hypothetical protein